MLSLPRFLAALTAVAFLAFGLSSMYTEMTIGRPGSTAAIGFVVLPIIAAVLAGAGFLAGILLRTLLRAAGYHGTAAGWLRLPGLALLLLVPGLAGVYGSRLVREAEADAQPRILQTTPAVTRSDAHGAATPGGSTLAAVPAGALSPDAELAGPPASGAHDEGLPPRPATRIWDGPAARVPAAGGLEPAPGSPSSGTALPAVTVNGLTVSFSLQGAHSPPVRLPALSYVNFVDALELRHHGEPAAYAVVVLGRATGRRAVVMLLSPDLRLLHAELVERRWPLHHPALCAVPAPRGDQPEIAVVGCAPKGALTLQVDTPA